MQKALSEFICRALEDDELNIAEIKIKAASDDAIRFSIDLGRLHIIWLSQNPKGEKKAFHVNLPKKLIFLV